MKTKSSCFLFLSLFLSVLIFDSSLAAAADNLIFAVTYIRHGDRAPYSKIDTPKLQYQWPYGIGELTPEGMHQEYLLGKELRSRYIDMFHLLPPTYKNNTMYVLSTDYSRTIISAESLLLGFYPPGTGPKLSDGATALPNAFQPVPVRTITGKQKNIIRPEQQDPEQFKLLMDNYSHTQKAWNEENSKLTADFKKWGKILDKQLNTFDDFLIAADTIRCASLHGLPLPAGLTKADVAKILNAADYLTALQYVPQPVAYFMASGFLSQLNADFRSAAAGTQQYSYILYSGHDTALCGIMSALGKPLAINPPYASHIDFELYKNDSNYFVKVRYNGEPVKFSDKTTNDSLTLKDFSQLLEPYLIKN
ncbi:MAG: histidine-type phosphatase [Negativicutes bacterium]|jgi:acid phosphatase